MRNAARGHAAGTPGRPAAERAAPNLGAPRPAAPKCAARPASRELAATTGRAAPVAVPPPGAPPPSYQSPYYAPPPGYPQPPVHRTPWMLIIGAIVGLVVLMAGCGTALALINARNQSSPTVGSNLPSPTPARPPSPIGPQPPRKGAATTARSSA